MTITPHRKLLIAGNFTEVNGVQRRTLARLNLHPPFKFAPLIPLAGGKVKLNLTTEPGKTYILETSTNLLEWTPRTTNSATAFKLDFDDPVAAKFPKRFYRARTP